MFYSVNIEKFSTEEEVSTSPIAEKDAAWHAQAVVARTALAPLWLDLMRPFVYTLHNTSHAIDDLVDKYKHKNAEPVDTLHDIVEMIGETTLRLATRYLTPTTVTTFRKHHEYVYWYDGFGLGDNPSYRATKQALKDKIERNGALGSSDAFELQHHIATWSIAEQTEAYRRGRLPKIIRSSAGLAIRLAGLHDEANGALMDNMRILKPGVVPTRRNNVRAVMSGDICLKPEYFREVRTASLPIEYDVHHRLIMHNPTLETVIPKPPKRSKSAEKPSKPPKPPVGCPLNHLELPEGVNPAMRAYWDLMATAYIAVVPGLVPEGSRY